MVVPVVFTVVAAAAVAVCSMASTRVLVVTVLMES
jgi:hypothetical protein